MARTTDPQGREADLLRRLVDFTGKDVLDVGCGEGRTTHTIALTASSVLGIDPDGERIAKARVEAESAERSACFRVADVVTLELPLAGLDAVVDPGSGSGSQPT